MKVQTALSVEHERKKSRDVIRDESARLEICSPLGESRPGIHDRRQGIAKIRHLIESCAEMSAPEHCAGDCGGMTHPHRFRVGNISHSMRKLAIESIEPVMRKELRERDGSHRSCSSRIKAAPSRLKRW